MKLRPYQIEALDSIVQAEKAGIKKQLVVLPTGSGKTVIFSHLPNYRENSLPMLVLAHREELLLQAKEKILIANPELKVSIEQANNYAEKNSDVICASVATLGRANSSRLSRFKPNNFSTIIIDEAHHAAAPSYKRILDYFQDSLHIGVTATPQRGDKVRLTDIFSEITYYKTIIEMINEGYLCDLVGYRIHSNTDIGDVAIMRGDYVESQLTDAIDNPERNKLIVKSYLEIADKKRAIVFAASVQHANNLLSEFSKAKIKANIIIGTTDSETRSKIRQSFKDGTTKVLINVGVLTEGFDEPLVECVILARPTKSSLLYTQIIGRGTRLAEDKEHCAIIDITDLSKKHKPIGLPTLMGLPPDFDLEGQPISSVVKQFEELESQSFSEAAQARTLKDIELSFERINMFLPPPPSDLVLEHSRLIWCEVGVDNFSLRINENKSININHNALGTWTVSVHNRDNESKVLGQTDSLREAFSRSDRWIANNYPESINLIDSNSAWRSDPPTPKQIKWLKKHNIPITGNITKGVASQILDKIFAEKPKPEKPKWLQDKINKEKMNKMM